MSFLPGLISGSLVAGGIYYAVFSYDLQSRALSNQRKLKELAERLQEPRVPAPPSAAERIHHNPRKTLLIQRWNEEVEGLFDTIRSWDKKVINWGRRIVGDDRA